MITLSIRLDFSDEDVGFCKAGDERQSRDSETSDELPSQIVCNGWFLKQANLSGLTLGLVEVSDDSCSSLVTLRLSIVYG